MPTPADQIRTAQVIASLCLATDLGMGFPFEHGLHATLTTMRLCAALGVDDETRVRTFYASLLMYAGCTVDAVERAEIFGGSMTRYHTHRQFGSKLESLTGVAMSLPSPRNSTPRRIYEIASGLPRASRFVTGHFAALCEVAGMLAHRLGMPDSISGMFPLLTERWDGASILERARGDEIPLPVRIVHVGRDATYQRLVGDDDHVKDVIQARSGKAFDPEVVACFLRNADEVLGPFALPATAWSEIESAEPKPWMMLEGSEIDRALGAIGVFSDLASPYLTGHSAGVADLVHSAALLAGFDEEEARIVRRAGFVHDVGRTAIGSKVWGKSVPLDADEREQVRLHPYHTGRVLARADSLSDIAGVAVAHHERLDGSGYHRGLDASSLSPSARLLAAADAFHSKTEPRPYRDLMSDAEATELVVRRAREGFLDPVMVEAVVEAAGQGSPRLERPAGLTDREVEVLGLVARGLRTKQIARKLEISPKTVDRHIQNSYRKIGVSSRAAATLYATEKGFIPR
ncbi:MAG TPA: HD domain-containing phosphohydrolase [Acidimicrobiia bacterium]|nr:HD domain-containing phosphohydrolase [Acidimicrobiia bacterium]